MFELLYTYFFFVNCWFLYMGVSSTTIKEKSFVDLQSLVC
jgi:hypothetical protein